MRLDAQLLGQGVDGIQGEVAFSTLDASEVPSRDTELLSEALLRQLAREAQIAHLRSEHLLQRALH